MIGVYLYHPYERKNAFTYQQKIAILNYLFTKNAFDFQRKNTRHLEVRLNFFYKGWENASKKTLTRNRTARESLIIQPYGINSRNL